MQLLSWLRQRPFGQLHNRPGRKHRPTAHYRPRLEALEDRSLPSTLTVLNTNDSGAGSLRAEIAAAQSGDTIVFDPNLAGQTINLTSGELVINKSLTIEGGGGVIDGNNASRVFDITSKSATVTLDNLVIRHGSAEEGGGVLNTGTLTLQNCYLSGNTTSVDKNGSQPQGGAVDNAGTMIVNNCIFFDNIASTYDFKNRFVGYIDVGAGGAIENQGTATVTSSAFYGNGAGQQGGAIDNQGNLTVSGCSFGSILQAQSVNSTVGGVGAGIANFGTMTVADSSFYGGGFGAAIANFGNADLSGSYIYGFVALFGGGVHNEGTMTVSSSTINSCSADDGGGIYNTGTLILSASTVAINYASEGGGIYNTGALYVTNASTVCFNSASAGADLYNLGKASISSDSDVCVIGP